MNVNRKRLELLVGICMALFSAVLLYAALQIKDSLRLGMAGTKLIPVAISSLMLACSLIRCVASFFDNEKKDIFIEVPDYRKWLLTILLLFTYAFILETVGFIIATVVLLAALSPLFGLTNPSKIIALSLIVPFSAWILFSKIFGNYLPYGPFI